MTALLDLSYFRIFSLRLRRIPERFKLLLYDTFPGLLESVGFRDRPEIFAGYLTCPFLGLVIHTAAFIPLVQSIIHSSQFSSGAT